MGQQLNATLPRVIDGMIPSNLYDSSGVTPYEQVKPYKANDMLYYNGNLYVANKDFTSNNNPDLATAIKNDVDIGNLTPVSSSGTIPASEQFTYASGGSTTFPLKQTPNYISDVWINSNGTATRLSDSGYTTSGKNITITAPLKPGDVIDVEYTYTATPTTSGESSSPSSPGYSGPAGGNIADGSITISKLSSELQQSVSKANNAVQRPGDTMVGQLLLSRDPVVPMEAATMQFAKNYTDSAIATQRVARDTEMQALNGQLSDAVTNVDLRTGDNPGEVKYRMAHGALGYTTGYQTVKVNGLGTAAYQPNTAFATSAQGAKADSAYQKPSTGIPKTDLATDVQNSLNKADASTTQAYVDQKVSDTDTKLTTAINQARTLADSMVKSVSLTTGTENGTVAYSVNGGTPTDVAVKGLQSAAYTPSSNYATAAQGDKADTAYQKPSTGVPITDLDVTTQGKINNAASTSYVDGKLVGVPTTQQVSQMISESSSSAFVNKGTVANMAALPTTATNSSMYYVTNTGSGSGGYYVADNSSGTLKWNPLSSTDLSAYSTTAQVDAKDVTTLTAAKSYTDSKLTDKLSVTGKAADSALLNGKSDTAFATAADGALARTAVQPSQISPMPDWVKGTTVKPTYTASEVGALPTTTNWAASSTPGGPAQKVEHPLSVKLNGVESVSYDGSADKSVNITPSSIGAATVQQGANADSALAAVNALPTWAKQTAPPVPTAAQVGALSATTGYASSSVPGGAADRVKSNLTLQLNGNLITQTVYNGNEEKMFNVTPSSIGAYVKPDGGIPTTDLVNSAQTSLGKAETAYQKPTTGIPSTDLASSVQTSLGKVDNAITSVSLRPSANAGTLTFSVNGTSRDVAVPALGTAAYTDASSYISSSTTINGKPINNGGNINLTPSDLGAAGQGLPTWQFLHSTAITINDNHLRFNQAVPASGDTNKVYINPNNNTAIRFVDAGCYHVTVVFTSAGYTGAPTLTGSLYPFGNLDVPPVKQGSIINVGATSASTTTAAFAINVNPGGNELKLFFDGGTIQFNPNTFPPTRILITRTDGNFVVKETQTTIQSNNALLLNNKPDTSFVQKPTTTPTTDNIMLFDSYGNAKDSGKKISDFTATQITQNLVGDTPFFTGRTLKKSDGVVKKIWGIIKRGHVVAGEQTWSTIPNMEIFTGFDSMINKIVDSTNTSFPMNYHDNGYLNISTRVKVNGEIFSKVLVLDSNRQPWDDNIAASSLNAILCVYYTRSDEGAVV